LRAPDGLQGEFELDPPLHDWTLVAAFSPESTPYTPTSVTLPQNTDVDSAAQSLIEAVHAAARAFDGRNLWLGVSEHNPRAISFYKKVGFVDRHHFFVGSDRQIDRVLVAPVRHESSHL
jgi:hypothetical protein